MPFRRLAGLTSVLLGLVAGVALFAASASADSDYYYRRGTFAIGGGINAPVGESNPYFNSSGSIFFSGGRNINRNWALQVEYTHHWLGIDQSVLNRAHADSISDEIHASMWSVTLNLVRRFERGNGIVPWVTAGGGYYKRNVLFTQYALVYYPPIFDPWWGWVDGGWTTGEAIVGQHASAAFGINGGVGLDMGIENGTNLFIEARYHYAFMDGAKMQLIPVMAGFRW